MMKMCTALVAPEWSTWYLEEMSHVPYYNKDNGAFSYVQSETLQILVLANIVYQKPYRPKHVLQTSLFWSPRMTMETAIASLIYQYLEQHPEKLIFRNNAEYYATKFRDGSRSLDTLLELYLQIIAALPGSRSMMIVPFDGPEAALFVKQMIDLCQYWSSNSHSMVIYHVTDPNLSAIPSAVELDNEYDIDRRMDTSEHLFRIAMMWLGVFENVSEIYSPVFGRASGALFDTI